VKPNVRDLLKLGAPKPVSQDLPGFFIKELTAGEAMQVFYGDVKGQLFRLVETALVDTQGRPLLEAGEAQKLPFHTFTLIADAANKINGMITPDAVEQRAGKSEASR
jgi:hypothetical protein